MKETPSSEPLRQASKPAYACEKQTQSNWLGYHGELAKCRKPFGPLARPSARARGDGGDVVYGFGRVGRACECREKVDETVKLSLHLHVVLVFLLELSGPELVRLLVLRVGGRHGATAHAAAS